MKSISIQAYAKVNLSLDVVGVLENGFHLVEMVMQQISLHDDVFLDWEPAPETSKGPNKPYIRLTTSRSDLPADDGNLAYRAAALMADEFPSHQGKLTIHIEKQIPVAAGMAGGSSNCAAVLHGLNQLWDLDLSVAELNVLGAKLGSDVPFCIMGQAAASESIADFFADDPMACHCALATGTGTTLIPLPSFDAFIAVSKPPIAVSTPEVYKGIDKMELGERPDNDKLISGLKTKQYKDVYENMINVLENYTLKVYAEVVYTKHNMMSLHPAGPVLMSGSGPTVFAICESSDEADFIAKEMTNINKESYSVVTTNLMRQGE